MRRHWVLSVFIIALAMINHSARLYGQNQSDRPGVGTIVTLEKLYFGKEGYKWIPMPYTHALGFTTQECDFVTTWEAVADYERVRTWKVTGEDGVIQQDVVQRMLEVTIGGRTYRGDLRDVGPFAFDLGLACVDLGVNPENLHRVSLSNDLTDSVDGLQTISVLEGAPIFNDRGEVVAMYMNSSGPKGAPMYVSAVDILKFLKAVKTVPRSRPLLLKP